MLDKDEILKSYYDDLANINRKLIENPDDEILQELKLDCLASIKRIIRYG